LFSLDTWHELSTVAAKPKFSRYLPYEMHMAFLRVLQPKEFVPIPTHVTVCRDATDNKFLELAIDGKADMIVSGDQDLLVMGSFQGIAIHDPATYLRLNLY
jgi:putative PIN family toxin of toxin-antitoxin system